MGRALDECRRTLGSIANTLQKTDEAVSRLPLPWYEGATYMPPPSLGSVNWGDIGTWKMYYTRKFEECGGVYHAKPHEMICDLEDIWCVRVPVRERVRVRV